MVMEIVMRHVESAEGVQLLLMFGARAELYLEASEFTAGSPVQVWTLPQEHQQQVASFKWLLSLQNKILYSCACLSVQVPVESAIQDTLLKVLWDCKAQQDRTQVPAGADAAKLDILFRCLLRVEWAE